MATNISKKRTFDEIRHEILKSLALGCKSINEVAQQTRINWRTADNHLEYLTSRGLTEEVLGSSYVRIFELTEEGKERIIRQIPWLRISEQKIQAKINGTLLKHLIKTYYENNENKFDRRDGVQEK